MDGHHGAWPWREQPQASPVGALSGLSVDSEGIGRTYVLLIIGFFSGSSVPAGSPSIEDNRQRRWRPDRRVPVVDCLV